MATVIKPSLGAAIIPVQEGVGSAPGYAALDARRAFSYTRTQSIEGESSFRVKERGGGANMSVDIAMSGPAIVQGGTVAQQGLYQVEPHEATINEPIAAANETNPRIDQVILRVYDNAIDSSGKNGAEVEVLKGTAEPGATLENHKGAAALPTSAVRLAYILVPAKATAIKAAEIEDVRPLATQPTAYVSAGGVTWNTVYKPPTTGRVTKAIVTISNGGAENIVKIKVGGVVIWESPAATQVKNVPVSFDIPPGTSWEAFGNGLGSLTAVYL